MSYREYFDIDPEYFPQVDKKIIEEQPDLWKKFYPHATEVNGRCSITQAEIIGMG